MAGETRGFRVTTQLNLFKSPRNTGNSYWEDNADKLDRQLTKGDNFLR